MVNLLVDLDERFAAPAGAEALAQLGGAGFDVAIRHGAGGRTLAWIDEAFGGTWSAEAFSAMNVVVSNDGAPVAFATFEPEQARFAWLRGEAARPGSGVFGPFGVDPRYRRGTVGPLVLKLALCELRARGHARAVIAAVGADRLVAYYRQWCDARVVETFDPFEHLAGPARTVILASGSGSNAQAVIDAVAGGLPLHLVAVVTNRRSAGVIERAARARIHCDVVPWNRAEATRAQYDAMLLAAVRAHRPQLVLLLGWMHLLSGSFVDAFPNLLNVHPAFLPHDSAQDEVVMPDGVTIPAFRGAHAVADAVAAGCRWTGASVHEVTMETDRGRIIARRPLALRPDEPEEAILERLHPIEHEAVVTGVKRWLYERPS